MHGKVALVVGGGGGIGRGVAARLAAAGAHVVIAGRSERLAPEVEAGLAGWRDRVGYVSADIADRAACAAMIADVVARHGRLDAVVNCANTLVPGMAGRFADVDAARFGAFLDASLGAMFVLVHAALPSLRRQGGAILLFASDSGRVAAPNQTMIGSTRAAIMMFARSLALEAAADGVRVNCISTSFVKDTPVWDMVMAGPIAARARTAASRAGLGLPGPGDIAELAMFLCSDASAHLTGQVISVNGGVSA